MIRYLPIVAVCIAIAGLTSPPVARAQTSGGPTSILIAYRSEPANRPAFRTYLQKDMLPKLAKLKSTGVLSRYQILFNPFTTSGTWDAMTILRFTSYAETQRWKLIERTEPGGLDAAGLRLAKPIDTYSADVPWETQVDNPGPEEEGVYYVIPYEYSSADQYRKYVDAYVIPQFTGWIREGVLTGYRLFMNRYQTGRPWDSLFILQYKNLESFGRREETVAKIRLTLKDNPEWQQLNSIKQTIRTESENTIAEALEPLKSR